MSGYVTLFADCLRCKRPFASNPNRVPTLRVNGTKEPICEPCFNVLNETRIQYGLEPWVLPEGAYSPAPEFEDEY